MLNHLSAITASPGSSLLINPNAINSSLSNIEPPYMSDINEKAPEGVIPANTFAVLLFL